MFENLVVFAAIVSSSRFRKLPMFQFITSVAVTDIIMSACVGRLVDNNRVPYNLMTICADRCVAVYWPLCYASLLTKTRIDFRFHLEFTLTDMIAIKRSIKCNSWELHAMKPELTYTL